MTMKAKILLSGVSAALCLVLAGCGKSAVRVEGVTLPAFLELEENEKGVLTARIWPADAANKLVSWKSDDTSVATVDPVSGEVVAVAIGETTVTATTDDGEKSAHCKVKVVEAGLDVFEKITNPVFRLYAEGADANHNGKLSVAEAADVKTLDMYRKKDETKITSLAGIEYFTGLTKLNFDGNEVSEADLSKNTALVILYCADNKFASLDLSKNEELSELICNGNALTTLDVSANTALTFLHCGDNALTSFDISKNDKLFWFNCEGNPGDEEGNFVVGAWFDNSSIPTGTYQTVPEKLEYYFSTEWTLDDKKEITVDYRKVETELGK